MNDNERDQIREEAKEILDRFVGALNKADLKKVGRPLLNEDGVRKEGEGSDSDPDFRKSMFENAPKKDGDFIIAEKKKW